MFDEAWAVQRPDGCPAPADLDAYAFAPDAAARASRWHAHASACEHCLKRVHELRAERTRFLESRPPDAFMRSLLAATQQSECDAPQTNASIRRQTADPKRRFLQRPLPAIVSAAALAACLAWAFLPGSRLLERQDAADVRLRGKSSSALFVYVSRGGSPARALHEGELLEAGDVLRFGVRTTRAGFASIVNIDERGRVTRYFPQRDAESLRIQENTPHALLPGSIRLDDFVGEELLALVVTDQPVSEARLRSSFEAAYTQSAGRLDRLRSPPLAQEIAFFSLRKHAR